MFSRHAFRLTPAASALLLLVGCATTGDPGTEALGPALDSITGEDLMRHIETLSDDSFEGRGPGTPGGRMTVEYLVGEFERLGLQPGNPDGTYVQKVPLVGFETESTASFATKNGIRPLTFGEDYVAVTRHAEPRIAVNNSEVVFVGYGVTAPEFGWDDFKDVDVRGKTVVMLVNDPQIVDGDGRFDDSMFKGKAMTYYGRWTYKYESASERGAAACIVVHETGPAGYPWEVVSGSWGRENFDVAGAGDAGRVQVEAWVPRAVAERLFADAGLDFAELKQAALSRDFRPVELPGARANFALDVTTREIESHNVIARIEGAHPTRKNEHIVFTAHWDHLGRDPSREGDQIFNGALDNATGTAAVLELAEAMTKLERPFDRSVLFLAVTAEEKGLLGSKYYASHPLWPLETTLANINMDGLNCYGPTHDVVSIGHGFSTLDGILAKQAAVQGRTVVPDAEPEKGFYFRSDHFSFVKQGVPALYAESGVDYEGRPAGWGQQRRDRYTANDYHKVSDEIQPDWDLSGAIEDVQLYLRVAWSISQGSAWPEWLEGTEFKAVREEALAGAAR